MTSVAGEDARDLELLQELEGAFRRFLHAAGFERPGARDAYLTKLSEISDRVLGKSN